MKITAWKFGKDNVTVKYETRDGAYTLKTEAEPDRALYDAAVAVADEAKAALAFNFGVSFSAITITDGDSPNAAIVLTTGTSIIEAAEVKCPKIDRKQHIDIDALTQALPGMEANTAPFVYSNFVELNLAIDIFLKEAEAFVVSTPKHEPGLFDELNEGEQAE